VQAVDENSGEDFAFADVEDYASEIENNFGSQRSQPLTQPTNRSERGAGSQLSQPLTQPTTLTERGANDIKHCFEVVEEPGADGIIVQKRECKWW